MCFSWFPSEAERRVMMLGQLMALYFLPRFPVNMQVSYRYRHLPGLYRTYRIPFANIGMVLFQYLHADTYNLQANVFWPGSFWIPTHQYIHTLSVNIFWPGTGLLLAYRYRLLTGKYLLAQYRFALSIPIPTSYQQISSGPVTFCPQHTGTGILLANIFWPSTTLPSAYRYQHLSSKYLSARYKCAIIISLATCYRQISSGPVPFCPQCTGTNIVLANIFWPSTILPSAYHYHHLTSKYLWVQYKFAFSILVATSYLQD